MAETSDTIISKLQHIADVSEEGFNKLAAAYGGGWKLDEVKSDSREEVLIRYTVGTGEFSEDMKFNVLRMNMFKMNGEPDGRHTGVWEPLIGPQDFFSGLNLPRVHSTNPKAPSTTSRSALLRRLSGRSATTAP